MRRSGPRTGLEQALAEADFEVAQLDARSTDWSVYAHHPNVYVRGLSLVRLRDQARVASEAPLRRVAELLGDTRPVHSARCVDLPTTYEQGLGIDFAKGLCVRDARTVSSLADDVLAAAEPSPVVAALVAHLAEPGLAELSSAYEGMLRPTSMRARHKVLGLLKRLRDTVRFGLVAVGGWMVAYGLLYWLKGWPGSPVVPWLCAAYGSLMVGSGLLLSWPSSPNQRLAAGLSLVLSSGLFLMLLLLLGSWDLQFMLLWAATGSAGLGSIVSSFRKRRRLRR
jgi:hypothetical protein